jgi:hypothetical protein
MPGILEWGDRFPEHRYIVVRIRHHPDHCLSPLGHYNDFCPWLKRASPELWKDADAGRPDVADACQRLSSLQK